MNGFIILIILMAGLAAAFLMEYLIHVRNLRSIPIRIHVNGTRGKSSVTRLIAAGLREGGIRTFAKTTGTLPRMIIHDGSEYPVFRKMGPNIIEQRRIVSFAASNKADALIIECMALQPLLQQMSEQKLIRSTIGVITNSREDHLNIMGPTERDVTLALLGTVPPGKILFTCERDYPEEFTGACRAKKCRLEVVGTDEAETVSEEEISKFTYMEHAENIALALRVCLHLGVPRETALRGMQNMRADEGAMCNLKMDFFGREIFFVNGFAANDPESTERIWDLACGSYPNVDKKIMVINCRIDRPDRSRQLAEAMTSWKMADKYMLIGSGTYFLIKFAVKKGVDARLFINAEGLPTEIIFEEILNNCERSTLVMGVGNIAGPGLELLKYFRNRSFGKA